MKKSCLQRDLECLTAAMPTLALSVAEAGGQCVWFGSRLCEMDGQQRAAGAEVDKVPQRIRLLHVAPLAFQCAPLQLYGWALPP